MKIRLRDNFQYLNHPLSDAEDTVSRSDGPHALIRKKLASRVFYSAGGSFLITGYRGVGKTTFVHSLINDLRQLSRENDDTGQRHLVDIRLNISRAISPEELMHQLIRGLYERLHQLDLWQHLDDGLRRQLELGVLRTSSTVSLREQDSRELLLASSVEMQSSWVKLKPSLRAERKAISSQNRDIAYLDYSAQLAERDLIHIARSLIKAGRNIPPRRNLFQRWRKQHSIEKIVFVFDELDKIDLPDAEKTHPVESILSCLKTLFTESEMTFFFIAGRDIYDSWLTDVRRGDSVLESIFAEALYLPTLWERTGDISDRFLPPGFASKAPYDVQMAYTHFRDFLSFRSRGIARKLLRGFNEFVQCENRKFYLEFSHKNLRQFRFFFRTTSEFKSTRTIYIKTSRRKKRYI